MRVAVILPTSFERGGEFLADVAALEAAGASAVLVEGADPVALVVLAAAAAVTHRVQVGSISGDAPPPGALETVDRLSHRRLLVFDRGPEPHRLTVRDAEPFESWLEVAMPADREAWKQALASHESDDVGGLVLRWDPRLIDLLRNPDGDDDRSDLQMSTG